MQNQIKVRQRRNRVFKSLHKPLTYLGVERSLFFFVCVLAVGMLQPLQFTVGRHCSVSGWLCLRLMANEQRSSFSSHPREIRQIQVALRPR